MKIAIHHTAGSFSDRWIEYCKNNDIPYKIVNAYDTDIIEQVSDCNAFLWHPSHGNYKDVLFSKQLLFSLQQAGKRVFPDSHTVWHFDDKVGQKYLLEAINAPLVPSYVFYSKQDALKWIQTTTFPKVFKLRGGAGASNVQLVQDVYEAKKLVRIAFGKGFSQFNKIGYLKDRFNKWRAGRDTLLGVCKGLGRMIIPTEFAKMHSREKGYVYFQDYIPNNGFDIRVIVIGDNAFAIKRMCRENDFRASGSGKIIYKKEELREDCVRVAFDVAAKIKSQCTAFDFVFSNDTPMIIEISYGFAMHGYDACEGYWTRDMKWHGGAFLPQYWIMEEIMK